MCPVHRPLSGPRPACLSPIHQDHRSLCQGEHFGLVSGPAQVLLPLTPLAGAGVVVRGVKIECVFVRVALGCGVHYCHALLAGPAHLASKCPTLSPWPTCTAPCWMQQGTCRLHGAWCRVQGAGCRVQGAGCRVEGGGRMVPDACEHRSSAIPGVSHKHVTGPLRTSSSFPDKNEASSAAHHACVKLAAFKVWGIVHAFF